MIYDLLDNVTTTAQYEEVDENGNMTTKSLQLNEEDDFYMRYRNKHIVECANGLNKEFAEFVKENKGTQDIKVGNDIDLKQVVDIVAKLPKYNELLTKYTGHMSLIERIIKVAAR